MSKTQVTQIPLLPLPASIIQQLPFAHAHTVPLLAKTTKKKKKKKNPLHALSDIILNHLTICSAFSKGHCSFNALNDPRVSRSPRFVTCHIGFCQDKIHWLGANSIILSNLVEICLYGLWSFMTYILKVKAQTSGPLKKEAPWASSAINLIFGHHIPLRLWHLTPLLVRLV